MMWTLQQLAWENAGPRLFYPRNDVWRTSKETSLLMTCYYPLSERGFWLVVPRWKFASTNKKHYQGLGSEIVKWFRYGFCAVVTQTSFRDLVITNTIFRILNHDKTPWMYPHPRHWHLIDYVIQERGTGMTWEWQGQCTLQTVGLTID